MCYWYFQKIWMGYLNPINFHEPRILLACEIGYFLRIWVRENQWCASSSSIILDRNSMVFYNIFHLHNFILYTFALTSLKRKILQKPQSLSNKSYKYKNLSIGSLTSENNTLKICILKPFVYKQKIY